MKNTLDYKLPYTNKIEDDVVFQNPWHSQLFAITVQLSETGNFSWKDAVNDSEVVFSPNPQGRWFISWMPKPENRNKFVIKQGKKHPANDHIGVGGVDSYDLDSTTDNRGSKGACHMYNKFSMGAPANMFVAEYASRPPLARIFYEDILMAAVFFGYPLLIENNKYGIVRYFESRGYEEYVMKRPDHLKTPNAVNTKTRGIPSNSVDVIQSHAQAIEAYVEEHVGINSETGEMGRMYFQRTLEDWAKFNINNRTKHDASISSGLAIMACNKNLYKPVADRSIKNVNLGIKRYNNEGSFSQIIK